ncbi:Glycosyltransferase involved in cell wall bisynthesis [Salinimicrobium sediminis]|uniref:Glycosyltransferase involved in cell wall bisynthesis n=1 Tax=Salinimicrobium sediminis TaxID=1343891 RepID=A0A285X2I6_9FLAO|nr:glycosyltransferase [Salinimicrobium sediminis]SOC78579.1 Glycosyltransferase involved in cell wall bisynthesis [Salinimicrobium sediminis]
MRNNIAIVIPVFNDWECIEHLIHNINIALAGKFEAIHLVFINDCSTELPSKSLEIPGYMTYSKVDLATNVGHQRAILIGLCYCFEQAIDTEYIIVMDSDGEDNPKYISQFLDKVNSSGKDQIIFAKRSKRSENLSFKLFYFLYKLLFRILTGSSISFGNFSCVPNSLLSKICNNPSFWNHYSASVMKAKLPYSIISTERGKRYSGHSKMNYNSLILHGLSSLSVYIESVIIRVLKLSFIVFVFLIFISILVIYVKYSSEYAIPGWATNVFGFILNLLITVVLFNLLIILTHLHNRNKPISKPIDFYKSYIVTQKP